VSQTPLDPSCSICSEQAHSMPLSVFVSRLGDLFIQIPFVPFDTGMVGI